MGIEQGHDDTQGNVASGAVQEIPEKTGTCPSCNYAADNEFETCPKCGLIVRKYYKHKQLNVIETFSGLITCQMCSAEISINSAFCPKCGEPRHGNMKTGGNHAKSIALIACLLAIVVVVLVVRQLRQDSGISPPSFAASQKVEPTKDTPPPAAGAPTDRESAKPPVDAADIPYAMGNSLGITRAKIVFATAMHKDNTPVNDLSRISINEKQIVAHVKMLGPHEKPYQCTGKFYDAEGNLVFDYTTPSVTPKTAIWYSWFYRNFDRSFEKPGLWKFVFFVNGEQIAERQIEVTD